LSFATIRLLDHSFPSPAENLACDEALLDQLDQGKGEPALRFWESPIPFVVVGYGNQIASEVNIAECARLEIPILRRTSGGGTVVQGPGCLNYTLVLPVAEETATIPDTNCFIMRKHREAFAELVGKEVAIQGHTDLTLGDLKFSGNAQRRKKNALLFHGCFLLDFNLDVIEHVLAHPSREPDYRGRRAHRDFLTNLKIPSASVKQTLIQTWNAHGEISLPHMGDLIRDHYGNAHWNAKF
jgi:lipoate---protein ligase